jgi:hypothetical protein
MSDLKFEDAVQLFNTRIDNEIEWLNTTEGDEIECISIENLQGALKDFIKLVEHLYNIETTQYKIEVLKSLTDKSINNQ